MIDLHEYINDDVWIIREALNFGVLGAGKQSSREDKAHTGVFAKSIFFSLLIRSQSEPLMRSSTLM